MNKAAFILLILIVIAACRQQPSWENEQVKESTRILSNDVKAEWTLGNVPPPGSAGSGGGTPIMLQITMKDGKPIVGFDLTHEKLLHFMIVSKDLSYFNHIHPAYMGAGVFEVANEFPSGGEYRFIADFKPTRGDAMTKMAWIKVPGDPVPAVPLERETTLTDETDGKRVDLSINALEAREDTTFIFTIRDQATNEPVTNLQPYLGAIGHVVVLSEDGERYLHVHAEEDQGAGPTAQFETSFPRSGLYKLWAQFQQDGQVFTASYTINVP